MICMKHHEAFSTVDCWGSPAAKETRLHTNACPSRLCRTRSRYLVWCCAFYGRLCHSIPHFFKSSWSVFKKNEDIYDAHVDLCRAMLECAWSLFQSQLWSLFKLIRILDYLSVLLNLNHCRLVMIDWCLFPAGQFCLLQLPHTVTPFSNFHSLFLRSGDVCGIDFGTTNCRVALWQDGGATQHREFVTISCPK